MPQHRDRHPVEPGNTAENGGILLALPVAALLKKVGEQVVDDLINVRPVRSAGQKHTILRRQCRAALQKSVLLRGKLCQLGCVGSQIKHLAVICTA